MWSVPSDKDYVSPGLKVVLPDVHFPSMRPGSRTDHPWKYLRREVPHHWYSDERFPLMGFMNRDEATLLYNTALQFAGKRALEIGAWLGWSTCHLALAGVKLDVIDPAHADPEFRALVEESLIGCAVSTSVNLTGLRSPQGVHTLAAQYNRTWQLFLIDGDHEAPAPECDVEACLPYAAADCAFVFHDLVSPAVAAGFQRLQSAGFNLLVYQTAQMMGIAWRGNVTPVKHVPDPEVAWQIPHHLVGLPIAGVSFATPPGVALPGDESARMETIVHEGLAQQRERSAGFRLLRDVVINGPSEQRPSVCVVSNEIIGPFKNGGIGTAMTGLAEHLARDGCQVTILYTGSLWTPEVPLEKWKASYAEIGIDLVALSLSDVAALDGPLVKSGFGSPYLVFRYLAERHFDVVHFNDCLGEGSLSLVAKKLGLAFQDTLLVVAVHSPSQWVLELNQTLPTDLVLSVFNYAERLSIKCADVVWSPSQYMLDWAVQHGFDLPAQTVVQPYCLPLQRTREHSARRLDFPEVSYGQVAPPNEIVFFGRLEPRKGLRLFCDAIDRLQDVLIERRVTVTFMGKPQTYAGTSSLAYLAERSRHWRCGVKTLTEFGQPEAVSYLRGGNRLAVIASPVDNSPCTVYEALAWGIPFLASRSGGIPELIRAADQQHVLFEPTPDALSAALVRVLEHGGCKAVPAQPQTEHRQTWSAFHATARQFLNEPHESAANVHVIALVDGHASGAELQLTLDALSTLPAVRKVIVLDRQYGTPTSVEDALAEHSDEAILLVHAGVGIRADDFAEMLGALSATDVDGLQPSAEIITGSSSKVITPLGGDPTFSLFRGATHTGGLLVRAEAFKRARLGRMLVPDNPFFGLADFCVTRGADIWPFPRPVFVQTVGWSPPVASNQPARLGAFAECSATDRFYMVAAGYGAATASQLQAQTRQIALLMIDLGLGRVVTAASWARRQSRRVRSRLLAGRINRRAGYGVREAV